MKDRLKFWAGIIGVGVPKTYRIPRKDMVTNENNRPYRYKGYCPDDDTLYYQGTLSDWDIVHELLHKKFPKIHKHSYMRQLTTIVLNAANKNKPPTK